MQHQHPRTLEASAAAHTSGGASYDGKIAGLYDLEETLGSGHFAVVKLARHVFTGAKVAVKVVDKTKLDEVSKAHLFQEVRYVCTPFRSSIVVLVMPITNNLCVPKMLWEKNTWKLKWCDKIQNILKTASLIPYLLPWHTTNKICNEWCTSVKDFQYPLSFMNVPHSINWEWGQWSFITQNYKTVAKNILNLYRDKP